jgi:hypothetical protein
MAADARARISPAVGSRRVDGYEALRVPAPPGVPETRPVREDDERVVVVTLHASGG